MPHLGPSVQEGLFLPKRVISFSVDLQQHSNTFSFVGGGTRLDRSKVRIYNTKLTRMSTPINKPNTRQSVKLGFGYNNVGGGVLVARTPPPQSPSDRISPLRPDRTSAEEENYRAHGDSLSENPGSSPSAPILRRRSSTSPRAMGRPDEVTVGTRQM